MTTPSALFAGRLQAHGRLFLRPAAGVRRPAGVSLSDALAATLQRSLGDAYELQRELGGGGMSRVFAAPAEAERYLMWPDAAVNTGRSMSVVFILPLLAFERGVAFEEAGQRSEAIRHLRTVRQAL